MNGRRESRPAEVRTSERVKRREGKKKGKPSPAECPEVNIVTPVFRLHSGDESLYIAPFSGTQAGPRDPDEALPIAP